MVAPGLLAACASDTDTEPAGASVAQSPAARGEVEGTPLVADVIDFALTSNEWQGAFGFVTLRLHPAVVEGKNSYFILTDTSVSSFAGSEGLVFAPRLGALAGPGLSGEMFLFDDDHPAVLSSEPGRNDYTPAWRIREVAWTGSPRKIDSVAALRQAEQKGDIKVRATNKILNAAVVKWSSGELPVDGDLKEYLGSGQLVEKPDTQGLKATFKLHECFPQARYIVVDTSLGTDGRRNGHRLFAGAGESLQRGCDRANQCFHERCQGTRPHGVPTIGVRLQSGCGGMEPVLGPHALRGRRTRRHGYWRPRMMSTRHERGANSMSFPGHQTPTARYSPSTARFR